MSVAKVVTFQFTHCHSLPSVLALLKEAEVLTTKYEYNSVKVPLQGTVLLGVLWRARADNVLHVKLCIS